MSRCGGGKVHSLQLPKRNTAQLQKGAGCKGGEGSVDAAQGVQALRTGGVADHSSNASLKRNPHFTLPTSFCPTLYRCVHGPAASHALLPLCRCRPNLLLLLIACSYAHAAPSHRKTRTCCQPTTAAQHLLPPNTCCCRSLPAHTIMLHPPTGIHGPAASGFPALGQRQRRPHGQARHSCTCGPRHSKGPTGTGVWCG